MNKIFINQKTVRWLVITSFLFAWIINISTIPLASLLTGNSHNLSFFSDNDNNTHLIFSHHEESSMIEDHEHISEHKNTLDSHDTFIDIISNDDIHPDHIIDILHLDTSSIKENTLLSNNYERGPPLFIFINTAFNFIPINEISFLKDYYFPSVLETIYLSLKTIILLI